MRTKTKHWASVTAGILSLAGYASAANIEKYTYDASGNIIEKSIDGKVTKMSFDQSNRLVDQHAAGHSRETIFSDGAGRPTAEKDANGQIHRSMIYGYGDKLLEIKSQEAKVGLYYNAGGQLVGKSTDGTVSTYGWDDNVLAADGASAFTNEEHITGGVPLLESERDIVISDYLGNTLSAGEKAFTSTAYGEGLESGRFTGKFFDKELESYVFHHRLYSPISNRWTFADPSGFPDGKNNFTYVNGSPTDKIDPLGLTVVDYPLVHVTAGLNPGNWAGAACDVYVLLESDYNVLATYQSAMVIPGTGAQPSNFLWTYNSANGLTQAPSTLEEKTINGIRNTRTKLGVRAYATVTFGNSQKTLIGVLAQTETTWIPEK